MKYGDFSSVVQLGVSIHLGTALLQLYGDLGVQPLIRTLSRIKSLLDASSGAEAALQDELSQLESDFEIFKIKLFHEYKKYVKINFSIAALLFVLLVTIAYRSDTSILPELSVALVALAVLPAPITLGALWCDATRAVRPMKARATALETRALRES